jgi:hypothetical protein
MIKKVPVFIKGIWMHVDVPSTLPSAMQFSFATTWVAARVKGLSEDDACIVAEAFVYQRMYPGLVHSEKVREMMKKVS